MTRIVTGSAYEAQLGYARAVIAGGVIYMSGCSGLAEPPGDAAAQFAVAVAKVEKFLAQAGAGLADVVQTRVYLTRVEDWAAVGAAHGAAFAGIRPACTMLQVARLIDPLMLVELEVTAHLPANPATA